MKAAEFKAARELHSMTAKEWAREIGLEGECADRTVRRYESGKTRIAGPVARCVELLLERKAKGKRK